jgi:hypothetical protein
MNRLVSRLAVPDPDSAEDFMSKALLAPILLDEALTRGLGDAEARMLVEWLVDRAEHCVDEAPSRASTEVDQLCRRARSIRRFVTLWFQDKGRGAACQLAATERFPWPLPGGEVDPCDLMHSILSWESQREAESAKR